MRSFYPKMSFKQLIRNLRIESEFDDFCKSKGLNKVLAHNIACSMLLNRTTKEMAQKFGIHHSTVKRYRQVLGSLEESRFNQFINIPQLNFLNPKKRRQ